MTAALAEACTGLATWYPVAAALIAEPDTGPATHGGKPGSRPPWNPAAANAALDAHALVRRLETALRAEVTGRPGRRRGGSDAATLAAIRAIGALGVNASHASASDAAHAMASCVIVIRQLPAIDEAERFHRVHGVACCYCGNTMLRLGERSGRVTCVRFGACFDSRGEHPVGFVAQSVTGEPMIAWDDGRCQYADLAPGDGTAVSAP